MERAEVLAQEDRAWADLMEAVAAVPAERRITEGVVPGWSTHDVVWHTAYWVSRAADVLVLACQGPPYPDEPENESFYDGENDRAFATGRGMTWDEVQDYFASGRDRARGAMERCADSDLEWMSERCSEEIGHFREHASQIRAFAANSSVS
jgi:hypothetical protein